MKKIADTKSSTRAMFRAAWDDDVRQGVVVVVSELGASLSHYESRVGTVRELVARNIYRDIERPESDGLSREGMARVWAESFIGQGQGSTLLVRALADVLRELGAEGDEWALEALSAFAPSPEAVAA